MFQAGKPAELPPPGARTAASDSRQPPVDPAASVPKPPEETTRLFQPIAPSAAPPFAPESPLAPKPPGEFTRTFLAPKPPDSLSTPPPPKSTLEASSEFARYFESPMRPSSAGDGRMPPAPPPQVKPAQAGGFTQMFGDPNRPAAPPPKPLGSVGSATGVFSSHTPQSPMRPQSKAPGPGEFTRMMSASALPTLGQPSPASATPPAQPRKKSMLPLYIGLGGVVVVIILIFVFFALRH